MLSHNKSYSKDFLHFKSNINEYKVIILNQPKSFIMR